MDIEWNETRAEPTYQYSSDDGLIDASVERDEHSGWWHWSVCVMAWREGPRQPGDIGIHGTNKAKRNIPGGNNSGKSHSAQEAMHDAQQWLEAYIAAREG